MVDTQIPKIDVFNPLVVSFRLFPCFSYMRFEHPWISMFGDRIPNFNVSFSSCIKTKNIDSTVKHVRDELLLCNVKTDERILHKENTQLHPAAMQDADFSILSLTHLLDFIRLMMHECETLNVRRLKSIMGDADHQTRALNLSSSKIGHVLTHT